LTDNIIVLDHVFNLTKKSSLIGRLYYDLPQYFDNLGVASFWATLYVLNGKTWRL